MEEIDFYDEDRDDGGYFAVDHQLLDHQDEDEREAEQHRE